MTKSGNADLEKEKAELEKNVESAAQKELEKEKEEERKNIEDQYGYEGRNDREEDNEGSDAHDSDEKPKKSNRGDGGYFGNKNTKDSDEDVTADAYSKPSRGGGKVRGGRGGRGGGRGFSGLNQDDFPSL